MATNFFLLYWILLKTKCPTRNLVELISHKKKLSVLKMRIINAKYSASFERKSCKNILVFPEFFNNSNKNLPKLVDLVMLVFK